MDETLAAARTGPWSPPEEENAIRRAQRNPAEFAAIYHQFVDPVFSYLYSRLGNRQEAEDLTSQVFLEALEGLHRYRFNAPFAAWVFTIARRRVIDYRRRPQPAALEVSGDPPSTAPDPLTEAVRSDDLRRLARQVGRLEEPERELLRLRFAAGLSYEAIGALQDRSPAAVKMHVHRLIKRLETQMEASHE
jgi:RNA polymerase sigma-70 factor (ECF subfamily)